MTLDLWRTDSTGAAVANETRLAPKRGNGLMEAVPSNDTGSDAGRDAHAQLRAAPGNFPDSASVAAADARTEQRVQIKRVRGGIGGIILEFCRGRGAGGVFTAADLRAYVEARNGGRAPSSSDRILRALQAEGALSYRVDRAASRYTLVSVSMVDP